MIDELFSYLLRFKSHSNFITRGLSQKYSKSRPLLLYWDQYDRCKSIKATNNMHSTSSLSFNTLAYMYLHSSNPEPDSLKEVSWNSPWPVSVLRIYDCLTSGNIGIFRIDERCSLEYFPENIQCQENWNANVCCKEIC